MWWGRCRGATGAGGGGGAEGFFDIRHQTFIISVVMFVMAGASSVASSGGSAMGLSTLHIFFLNIFLRYAQKILADFPIVFF